MENKGFTWLLDAASGITFVFGFITAHDLLMILGGLASTAALLNHGYDFYKKIKKK